MLEESQGRQHGKLLVTNCYNRGKITSNGWSYAGGILGDPYAGGNIYNSYNTGNLEVLDSGSTYRQASGIGPMETRGTIKNCYNTGTFTGGVGQNYVIGTKTTGNDENCYYLEELQNVKIDTSATAFTKETSSQVVASLNQYIEEHLQDETINTSTWKKWKIGDDRLSGI